MVKELWFTPSDYSPSYKVKVAGDVVELVYMQDIWPGYDGAKEVAITQGHIDFIQRPDVKARILEIAKR